MLLISISPVILALLDSIQELEELRGNAFSDTLELAQNAVEVQRLPTSQACMSFHSDT